jgi:drug/metabolite transporter (DMT)-like permease
VSNSRSTRFALAATAALWASAFPAIKVALDGYDVAALSFLRLLVASVALALVAPLLGVRLPGLRDLGWVALAGASGMSAYQVLLNWGEVHVPAGTASLIVAVAPVFSVLLATAFLGERPTVRIGVGSAVAIGGSAVIALSGGDTRYTLGAWVVLAAAFVQGVYHFASKPLLARYTAVEVACYATWIGTLFLAPLAPRAIGLVAVAPPGASLAVAFLGLLPSALGFVVWGFAVARSTVSAATAVLYLVPVLALGVSFVWLGERPTVLELVGGLIIIGGVAIIRATRRRSSADDAIGPTRRKSARR